MELPVGRHVPCFGPEAMDDEGDQNEATTDASAVGLVEPEVVNEIRMENQALLRTTASIQASLETGRFDEAGPIAAELRHVLVRHVLLVDGVLDVLSPDDVVSPSARRRR